MICLCFRLNHSCSPLVVWSWLSGAATSKEVRAIRDIQAGEELTANYIDSFEVRNTSSFCCPYRVILGNLVNESGQAEETEVS